MKSLIRYTFIKKVHKRLEELQSRRDVCIDGMNQTNKILAPLVVRNITIVAYLSIPSIDIFFLQGWGNIGISINRAFDSLNVT